VWSPDGPPGDGAAPWIHCRGAGGAAAAQRRRGHPARRARSRTGTHCTAPPECVRASRAHTPGSRRTSGVAAAAISSSHGCCGAISGVQANSSVTLLVAALVILLDLLFQTAALVDVGRCQAAFGGPVTARTAHRRPTDGPQSAQRKSPLALHRRVLDPRADGVQGSR
jgi:hypothetical protein